MSDKIIQFPGGGAKANPGKDAEGASDAARGKDPQSAKSSGAKASKKGKPAESAGEGDALTEDQRKAMGIVLSGMPFVVIGIKPTPSGADFFTSVSGEGADLRNAEPHLTGVIERALSKKGF